MKFISLCTVNLTLAKEKLTKICNEIILCKFILNQTKNNNYS